MCGLCGIAGPGIVGGDIKAFQQLLFLSSFRGTDSTGVAAVNSRTGAIKLCKEAMPSPLFLAADRAKTVPVLSGLANNVFIGHTRDATVGAVVVENAHPFEFENLIGAHNGTLKDKRYFESGWTDSELLFQDMNGRGIKPVLDDLYENAAFALTIFDKTDRTINFAMSGHRSFFIGINKKRSVVYWASELQMLDFVLDRLKIEADYFELENRVLYSYDPTSADTRIENWERITLTCKKSPQKTDREGPSTCMICGWVDATVNNNVCQWCEQRYGADKGMW